MRGVMDALDINQAIVGGHSMGANVALNFAIRYPERCLGLITVSIGSGSSDRQYWDKWWDKLADLAEQRGLAAFLEEMRKLPSWAYALDDPQLGSHIRDTVFCCSPRAIAHTVRGIQKRRPSIFQLQPGLEKLPVATLVILSEGDTPVLECSRFLAQHIPQATLESIPARSHWTHLEMPERFCQVVERFIIRRGTTTEDHRYD